MAKQGILAFTKWYDNQVWYPKGRDILKTTYPGMMLYTYFIHKCVSLFYTVDVYNICVIFPIIGGLFTLYTVYKLAILIANERCARVALFLCSIIPGFSQRTMSGFFDYECVSVGLINLCSYYYLKYLKTGKAKYVYAFLFTYFNLGLCWGGYVFVMNFIALHSMSSLILFRYKEWFTKYFPRLIRKSYNAKTFSLFYVIGNGCLCVIPVIGKRSFLSQEQLIPLLVFIQHVWTFKKLRIPALCAVPVVLYASKAAFCTGKLLNLFIKQKGSALVESISEHAPRGFVKFFLDSNILCFLMPMSFSVLYDLESTTSTFMIIYAIISVFISAKIVRCILIATPCFCICSSLYILKLYESVKDIPFRKRLFTCVSGLFSIYFTLHSFKLAYHTYSCPQILLVSTDGRLITDFHDSYRFLSRFEGVILNWWDYGYQINAYSNMKTLNDNNTNDWERIKQVAQIYMSDEKHAHDLCIKNNIDCVFIVSGVDSGFAYDMISKSSWIDRIARENCDFVNAGKESMLYRLVYYGNTSLYDFARKGHYQPVELEYFSLVYRSDYGIIKIYQVLK